MASNRTVSSNARVGVTDVTDDAARALARAAYEARKSSITALEAQKADLKQDLDECNVKIADARGLARALQMQIDRVDEAITDLKVNG